MLLATLALFCGCWIQKSMGEVAVGFCNEHRHLYSDEKSGEELEMDLWSVVRQDKKRDSE